MAFEVHCAKCGARFTLPDDLYERKVRGRVVTVRCKKCRADITVDGTNVDSDAEHQGTPTVPLSSPGSLPAVGGLWVVSFGDDDDRELTMGQLKKALEKGEINRETLVWNVSLDEWLMISEVPALADLIVTDEVGGFLGTGVAIGSEANELLGEDEIGPFRSVGAGTMSDRAEGSAADEGSSEAKLKSETHAAKADEKPAAKEKVAAAEPAKEAKTVEPPVVEGTPTVPLAMPPVRAKKSAEPEITEAASELSKPPPKPARKLPTAPVKARPAWLSESAKPPATEDPDLPEGEEAAPSSGTPDLRSLMTGSLPPPDDAEKDKGDSASEDIFAIGGGGIAAALPTIDLTNIEPPPPSSDPKSSRRRRDEDAPVSSDRPRAKSKKTESSSTKGKRPPPAPSARDSKAAKAASAAEEEKSGSPAVWLVLAGVAAVAVYWFFLRNPDGAASTEPTARPTGETRTEVTPPQPTLAPPPTAAPAADAATPAANDAAVAKKEEKPLEKVEKPEGPTAKEEKPAGEKPAGEKPAGEKPAASATTGGDVAMAAPFDANAARSALSSAAGAASGCRQEGDPAGTATVVVTFAPSGRVTSANISGPPFAGTKTGGCIAAAMRGAKVPAFSGEHVTVSKTVNVQ